MVRVSRSPFAEQPNGDLVCTITIPLADRAKVLFGHPIQLAMLPGAPESPRAAIPAPAAPPVEKAEFTVDLPSEPAEKPPTQCIAAVGQDQAAVLENADIATGWEHACAKYVHTICAHTPFGLYAQENAGPAVNAWQSPMQVAMALLLHVTAGKDISGARAAIERLMDRYIEWAKQRNLPAWPATE